MKKEFEGETFGEEEKLRQAKLKEILEQIAVKTGVQIPVRELDRKQMEEKFAYIKAKTKEIEDRILSLAGNLFDSPQEKETLQIAIRIVCEFHKFLVDFGDAPPRYEAEYVAETIRSGLDWFLPLAITCHYLDDERAAWSFDRQAVSNFRDLRRACLARFERLCDPSAPIGATLAALLAFIHLELVFMAQTYPFFVGSYEKGDQWLTNRT